MDIVQFLNRDYQGYFGKLDSIQLGKLADELTGKLYTTTQMVCDWVQHTFGVKYTQSGMSRLLHRLGFTYKKTKPVPCKADKSKQEAFLRQLEALLEEDNSMIYFTDGVHPTHNTRSLNGWIPKGEEHEIPTVSGRDRININGAVNARNPQEVIIEEGERINAQNTQALYEKLIEANPDAEEAILAITGRKSTYGVPRVRAILRRDYGIELSRYMVHKFMKQENLLVKRGASEEQAVHIQARLQLTTPIPDGQVILLR